MLLSPSQYIQTKTEKKQIVLHHTVSGDGTAGDIAWWNQTPERVATHYIIARSGEVVEVFPDEYWAYNLGLKASHFSAVGLNHRNLDSQSIGIELDSWGPLVRDGAKFHPVGYPKVEVKYPYEYCTTAKYRGYQFYEKYTTAQIAALKELLLKLCAKHNIDKSYHEPMFDAPNKKALRGDSGIFSHSSYRVDKSDVHPQVELVKMLRSL